VLYGVPHHTDVSAIVYNKDLFRSAGIGALPDRLEDAWSWDEFLDVARRLRDAGLDVFYVDYSSPNGEVSAVKAIVPGLEVETMSYGRIGPRSLHRLLDRDSDLIVTGDASGRPAARRILLAPEREAQLGPA
jgi:hypothetical protein